jgi:hypothetical protein
VCASEIAKCFKPGTLSDKWTEVYEILQVVNLCGGSW